MPIWRNAGGDILLAGTVPALVRAWTYRPRISDCLYGPIAIIGCNPPACVNFKNTNVNPNWFEFIRGACGAWSGSGGYAWPADVPSCPYPAGISIESTNCTTGGLVELKVAITGDLFKCFTLRCWNFGDPGGNVCTGMEYSQMGSYPDESLVCPAWPGNCMLPPVQCGDDYSNSSSRPHGFNLTRSGGGWGGSVPGGVKYYPVWEILDNYSVSVNCAGAVSFLAVPPDFNSRVYFSGSGSIALDAEYLPIGTTGMAITCTRDGMGSINAYAGTLSLTVSKI